MMTRRWSCFRVDPFGRNHPALESAHALGALAKVNFKPEEVVVLTVSGRGDKDMDTYINYKLS